MIRLALCLLALFALCLPADASHVRRVAVVKVSANHRNVFAAPAHHDVLALRRVRVDVDDCHYQPVEEEIVALPKRFRASTGSYCHDDAEIVAARFRSAAYADYLDRVRLSRVRADHGGGFLNLNVGRALNLRLGR